MRVDVTISIVFPKASDVPFVVLVVYSKSNYKERGNKKANSYDMYKYMYICMYVLLAIFSNLKIKE